MKYHVTSAEAAKLLKKLLDEKSILLADEYRSSTFNAALGEDVESVRPMYDYAATATERSGCSSMPSTALIPPSWWGIPA